MIRSWLFSKRTINSMKQLGPPFYLGRSLRQGGDGLKGEISSTTGVFAPFKGFAAWLSVIRSKFTPRLS